MAVETMTHLERRKIEAQVLIPMLQAFQRAFGAEQANTVAREVFLGWARDAGAHFAERFGNDFAGLEEVWKVWAGGGVLELEDWQQSDASLSFSVTRCGYAEFFRSRGLAELGFLLCCNRDHAVVEGFNPEMSLSRTQTLMQGTSHCNFRYERKT